MEELFSYGVIYAVRNRARMGKVKELSCSHIATSANLSRMQLNVTDLRSSTIVSNHQSCYCTKFNNSLTSLAVRISCDFLRYTNYDVTAAQSKWTSDIFKIDFSIIKEPIQNKNYVRQTRVCHLILLVIYNYRPFDYITTSLSSRRI